jgi:hypothetical protein
MVAADAMLIAGSDPNGDQPDDDDGDDRDDATPDGDTPNPVTAEFVRDAATAAVFGFFAASWFGCLLTARKRRELIPAWVAVVVGVHLLPLAWLLRYPFLAVVGTLVAAAGVLAVPFARARNLAVRAIVGVSAGAILLTAASISLATVVV